MNKRFYPVGMKVSKGQPANIQELILVTLARRPRMTQKELAGKLGVDVSTINYHVNMMAGAGLLVSEKKGRAKRYSVEEEAMVEAYAG